ncbi:hypothetical protein Mal4_10970 [Maioricimonas rarisocia]|uniref:Alpha/beta hydrolase family protein n=1 Tax=Maioricimonas rarisocia TaxID=2528026 RepID=A0A517Z2U5_9PLAN|nr:hypothetical protein [Maioricimonas rarisocia]QDU36799.1 hypothetical protein Mal4_10970 [Maioricimonas rarisocia]
MRGARAAAIIARTWIAGLGLLLAGCAMTPQSSVDHWLCRTPASHKDRVHVFLVESPIDVVQLGDLPEIAEHLRDLGYRNVTYYNPMGMGNIRRPYGVESGGHGAMVAAQVLCARRNDPHARVLLYGWSAGSIVVRDAVGILEAHGESVDCAIYVDSRWVGPYSEGKPHPRNVRRTALIYRDPHSSPWFPYEPPDCPNAVLYRVRRMGHLSVPTHPDGLEPLMREVSRLTMKGCACL